MLDRIHSRWPLATCHEVDWSDDDGRTWTAIAGDGFHAFSFSPTGRVGWGAGENGRIALLRR